MNPLRYSLLFLCFVLLNGQRRIFNHVFISNQNQNQSTFECPEEFGYYPHPMDCTQYYVCVFGGPLLESCTGGLMYSHELQTCDWPRNVDCVNNEQRLVTVTTTTELPVMRFYENKNYQNDFFARPTPVIVSRGQPRQLINENLSNFMIKKQTVPLINDHITKNENDDRQQRVYRGQPSLIGQVQRDRDGLNHINSIIVNRNDEPQKEKEDFMEYTNNDQLDEKLRTKFGQNQFKENYYNNNNNKNYNSNIKNNSQQYDTINYDSYYSIYDDDVELFRDKELEKEYNVKNENIDTKKITQNVPLKIVPHVTNPTQHLFSTQPTYISTENYNQKQKDSEHTVKIYDEIESIKNKDLSLMRGNKYLVNSNYLDSILSTVHDAGLTGTTLPTTLTTGQASTIDSKYLNQPEYVTKVTVPVSRSINNDNGIRSQNQVNHEINPTTFSPNQFYLQMISKNNDNNYLKSKNKPYKVKTIKKILTSTKKTKPSTSITTTTSTTASTTTSMSNTIRQAASKISLSNTYTETNQNNYKDNYYEANLSMVTQTDIPIKISEEENLIDFNTYHNPNITINFLPDFNDSVNKIENHINSYNKNNDSIQNVNRKITNMMDSMIKKKQIFLKYNNYSVNNNQPLNNYNYSVKNSSKFWTDKKSHSSKCYNQQTHLCNDYKSRRQRPTLRPPSSIVTKNHEFINIYKSVPKRPESIYPTPLPDKTAAKCRKDICLLPDCNCGGKDIPGDLPVEEVPQIVLLTFDDSVNDLNKGLYNDLFNNGRRNPNGCPITATFYVSHEWTDYSQVQNLYADGHEIASHTISHSFGEQFSQKKWYMEVAGQREILAAYGGVNMEDIRGMRAPFLSVGGNKMFKMLYEANFTYDSSMPVYENRPPSYPYTLDYKLFHDCMIPPCPSKSYPGVWEVPMVMWQDLNGGRCSMGDACSNPMNSENVYQMIKKNFERHYTTNRAPFGLFYHAAWFTQQHHKDGFIRFLDEINQLNDVYILTNWQAIQWVREPMPLSKLKNFQPFDCDYKNRPKKCFHPRVCNLWHKSGVRYMRTCQTCPDIYPWTGKTGVKSSRMENDNTIE